MIKTIGLACGLGALLAAASAQASSSDWFQADGASVRLITTGSPGPDGMLKGILDIELQPGWKTYWRDPGDAGVPPTMDVSASTNVEAAELDFPAPERHDEGDLKWAGYNHPVSLPVTFKVPAPGQPALIEADIFLGICETICVPVSARLTLDPASDPDNADDAADVEAAVTALPEPATADFGVKVVSPPGSAQAILEAAFPGSERSAELFIAGEEGYAFTTPARSEKDGKTYFSTNVERPAEVRTGPGIRYTLVTQAGAVSGVLPYF